LEIVKGQRIFWFMLVLCLALAGGASQSWISVTGQSDLDKLALLYCRSIPFALTTPVSGHCRSEIAVPALASGQIPTGD
jgi:hypothetical protein